MEDIQQGSRFWFWYSVSAGLLVAVFAVGWYFVAHKQALAPTTSDTEVATSTSQGSYTITPIGVGTSGQGPTKVPAPSLDRAYTPPADAPASIQAEDRDAVAASIAEL